MNDFVRCNKVSGVYWLKAPVENLTVIIKLKPPDDILSLPKFEDFTNEVNNITIQPNIEEHSFKWQEKSFSTWELRQYTNIHNCITDTEIKYHEMIKNYEIIPTKVFTKTNDDNHAELVIDSRNKSISTLESCLEHLKLSDTAGGFGRGFGKTSDSMSRLLKSQNSLCEGEKWVAMHVLYDHLDQNEDSQFLKEETTLLSIYHNTTQNYVVLSPDVNDLEWNPYAVETVDIKYGVSVDFGEEEVGGELETLLTRMFTKWVKKHKVLVNFIMPPLGRTQFHITIDLMSAEGFEMDNLYIEYTIKLPEGVQCIDALHGRTHTSKSTSEEDNDVWNFGHLIELGLETGGSECSPIKLYLEVISTDWRHNHRTEGYVYHPLAVIPGFRTLELTCLRPAAKSWRGEDRRFFLGGCNLIQDLDVLSKTDGQNTDFIYTTTGKVHLRHSIIAQSGSSAIPRTHGTSSCEVGHPSSSGSSALLLGAETALNKYKKARARLAAATRDINIGSGDG